MSDPGLSSGNLFANLPVASEDEIFESVLERPGLRLHRIVSNGQSSPPTGWYDQNDHEWVVILSGSAGLEIEGEKTIRTLRPGDYVYLPAHLRHRVAWTDKNHPTVWLAIHHH